MNFKLLILRVLKILERGLASQKFEVHPVTGDALVDMVLQIGSKTTHGMSPTVKVDPKVKT